MDIMTRSDVEKLKQGWLKDPCWDLASTNGTEWNPYREELAKFQIEQEKIWMNLAENEVSSFTQEDDDISKEDEHVSLILESRDAREASKEMAANMSEKKFVQALESVG